MKTRALKSLIAGFGLLLAGHAPAQQFTVLHSFPNGGDMGSPEGGLVLSGNTLYGKASFGPPGNGGIFAVNTDGSGYTEPHYFAGYPYDGSEYGQSPSDGLILSNGILYGTTYLGGTNYYSQGIVFSYDIAKGAYSIGHNFNLAPDDGIRPAAGLLFSGNILYGTTYGGGSDNRGTVFAAGTDGSYTKLHDFSAYLSGPPYTNSDGAYPEAGLVLSSNTLYGTTAWGGTNGDYSQSYGTIFAVNTSGSNFTVLHYFANNGDGYSPQSTMVLSGNTLYGTAVGGAKLFAINTDGSGFRTLQSYAGGRPYGNLALSGNTLYGTWYQGGATAVFAINTDGTGYTNLYSLNAPTDGSGGNGVIISGNALYGTTQTGGTNAGGTVFKLTIPISLNYQKFGNAMVLSWNDPSFVLQSAPAVTGTYTNVPNAASPYTNTFTGPQQFFRLLVSQ